MNALFYLLKSGCQWRMLPNDFAPWKTVYDHFQKWIRSGRIERLCTRLRRAVRLMAGGHLSPSVAVTRGAQSVPTARQGGSRSRDAVEDADAGFRAVLGENDDLRDRQLVLRCVLVELEQGLYEGQPGPRLQWLVLPLLLCSPGIARWPCRGLPRGALETFGPSSSSRRARWTRCRRRVCGRGRGS